MENFGIFCSISEYVIQFWNIFFDIGIVFNFWQNIHPCPNSVKIMSCDMCSKEFKSKDAKHELNIHKLKVHEGVEPIMCPQCPMAFATKNVLNNHLRGVHTNREFKCDQCEKIFTAKHTLKFHVMTLHSEGPVEFKCSHCPET